MENAPVEKEHNLLPLVSVVYEDDAVCVVDKPEGLMVHNDGRSDQATLVDWFLGHAPEARDVGEGQIQGGVALERSGVVHRLDRETSGVMIFAKTQEAFVHLKEQFQSRHVRKEYRAFVYGAMKEKWGTISRPIGRSSRDFRLRSAQRGARGTLRDAVTDWELIEQNDSYAYVRLMPKTGRTHQLRVHLKAIGRPIVGDTLYAPPTLLAIESLGLTRMALHAHVLELTLPSGVTQRFEAPLPEAFLEAAMRVVNQ